ncbi:hypothetical protein V8E55_008257 [Tylopilus felleus]
MHTWSAENWNTLAARATNSMQSLCTLKHNSCIRWPPAHGPILDSVSSNIMYQSVSSAEHVHTAVVLRIARMCQMAGSVVVVYDHVLKFDQEVDHVWNRPLSSGSINYILIRYFGDALAILNLINFFGGTQTEQVCKVYFLVQSWLGVLVLFLTQLTLQARLYALYRESKKILAFMVFGYVCEIVAIVVILGLLDADSQITNETLPGLHICANTQGPSFFQPYILWLPVVVYDGILCLLAAWRGIRSWMEGYRFRRLNGVYIADVLVKDNVGYFLCILLTCIVSAVTAQTFGARRLWMEVSEEFPAPMEVVIGCRLILNLRSCLIQDTEKDSEDHDFQDDVRWSVLRPLSSP